MEVEFYKTEAGKEVIEDFLNSLPAKDLAKVLRDIDLLSNYAFDLHEPYTKHINGKIWELRSKYSTNIYRILYATWNGKLLLLHGFVKKTQKTPPAEIDLAKKRLQEYEKNSRQL